jgi:hypothetical protein
MVTPTPDALATYFYYGNLLLWGIVFFIVVIFVAIFVLIPRLDARISMPIIDMVKSGYDLIARLVNGAGTILSLIFKSAFTILYLIIVLWALLIVLVVAYNILSMALSQVHPHLP